MERPRPEVIVSCLYAILLRNDGQSNGPKHVVCVYIYIYIYIYIYYIIISCVSLSTKKINLVIYHTGITAKVKVTL